MSSDLILGVRRDDSILYQVERRSGLAWQYDNAPNTKDTAFISARTVDKLTIYVIGNQLTTKRFSITVLDATVSDNIVVPKNGYDYKRMRYEDIPRSYSYYEITDGIKELDTFSSVK